jgi:ABC-type branched-subunit amino acid transport system ATPase component
VISIVLEAHNLRLCGADGHLALAGVTVFAHPGEILAVVGGHGAGKSALLRTVAGVATPESGTVRLDGADLTPLGAHERSSRGIAYIGDGRRVLDRLSVRDNLLLGARRRRDRTAVAAELEEWLRRFPGLAAARARRAATLEPALRTAAALGRAWLARPSVLMVDEPFVRVGDEPRAGIEAALRAARDAGLVVICAFHEPADASIADRVNLMSTGRLVFSGSPAALAASGAAASLE